MTTRPHLFRLSLAATLLAAASVAGAQNCLGVPLEPSRKSLGLMYSSPQLEAGEGDEGALGLTFGTARKDGRAARVELATRTIMKDNSASTVEDFTITRISARLAQPLRLNQASGPTTGSGWCTMAQVATAITTSYSSEEELGRAPSPASAAYSVAAGAGWAVSTPSVAFFAGPLLGWSTAKGASSTFVTMHTGAGVSLGRLLLNAELNTPLGSETALNTFDVRIGWSW